MADAKLLELALKIVGRVALLLETLGDCSNYVAEYLLLRLALVCAMLSRLMAMD